MPLAVGTILENRYRIEALLGAGGMGSVYRAADLRLDRPVAIKENTVASPESARQFEREAKVLARLRHPNLPTVSDHFVAPDGAQYLVMDFVGGEDLDQMLRRLGALNQSHAVAWIDQVCDALIYLHSQRPPIIHRDLKPANIKITPEGRVYLVDFGIAKVGDAQAKTATGALGVTPGFSPPEQYGEGGTDPRSDVYALGATLYALLTGQTPPDSVLRAIQAASLPAARNVRPDINASVATAIESALSTRPTDRPQTMAAFKAMLRGEPGPRAVARETEPTVAMGQPGRAEPERHSPQPAVDRPLSPPRPVAKPSTQPRLSRSPVAEGRAFPVALLWGALAIVVLALTAALVFWVFGPSRDGGTPTAGGVRNAIATTPAPSPQPAITTATFAATLAPAATPTSPATTPIVIESATPSATPTPSLTPSATATEEETPETLDDDQVLVPSGPYPRGSTRAEIRRVVDDLCASYVESWCVESAFEDELNRQEVSPSAFHIDRTEVTNANYARCVAAGACTPPAREGTNPRHEYYYDGRHDEYPVVYATWNDARDYCAWAGGRLPTAAEWEKAARGTDGRWWPWGGTYPTTEANYRRPGQPAADEKDAGLVGGDLKPVGYYPADSSPYGAMDMAGNVMEWVDAWYDANKRREIKGGSWNTGSFRTRAAARVGVAPNLAFFDVGFRCARDANP